MHKLFAFCFVFFCTLAQGCALDFERCCDVVIGYGNYEYIGPQVISTGSTGSFLSDPAYLFDGKPSSVTRLQWPSGAQTTSTYLGVEWFLANHGGDTPEDVTAGMVGIINTSLPAGIVVKVYDGTIVGTLVAQGTMQANANGTTSAWLKWTNRQMGSTQAVAQFFNDDGSGTPISASEEFTIGEIFMGARSDWCMKRDSRTGWVQGPRVRYSSAGTQAPVIVPSVRTFGFNLRPVTQEEAFSLDLPDVDMETLVTAINASQIVAVMPFEILDPAYYAPKTTATTDAAKLRAKTAFLGTFLNTPTISGRGGGDSLYDVAMQFQESV